jgi:hypothetical protein
VRFESGEYDRWRVYDTGYERAYGGVDEFNYDGVVANNSDYDDIDDDQLSPPTTFDSIVGVARCGSLRRY